MRYRFAMIDKKPNKRIKTPAAANLMADFRSTAVGPADRLSEIFVNKYKLLLTFAKIYVRLNAEGGLGSRRTEIQSSKNILSD